MHNSAIPVKYPVLYITASAIKPKDILVAKNGHRTEETPYGIGQLGLLAMNVKASRKQKITASVAGDIKGAQ